MLAHFILNNRKHAYGDETKEILRNLEKSTPKLLTNDVDQQDLITWMLLYEPNDRPTIAQVLAYAAPNIIRYSSLLLQLLQTCVFLARRKEMAFYFNL